MPLSDIIGLVVGRPRTAIEGGDIDIPLDAALATVHTYRNAITGEPIEDGSEIHDHVIAEPEELTIEGLVSDHPSRIFGGVPGGALGAGIGGLVGGTSGAALGSLVGEVLADVAGGDAPSLQAFELLIDAWREARSLRIVTRYATYEDMVIESLEVPHEAPHGQALRFTARFRHVITVQSQDVSTSLVDVVTGVADSASPATDRGRVTAETPDAAVTRSLDDYRLEMSF